jgi:NAD(P)-dependent dehydrogenase (short-subunit alcohol dehydrogenase family)
MLAGVNAPDRETWIKPEEIAGLAVFLASDESSSVVGAVIDAFGASSPLFR